MNETKKIDVTQLYLATIKYNDNITGCGVFKMTNKIVDIDTNAEYKITDIKDNKLILDNDIEFKGLVPLTQVFPYLYGKYPVYRILKLYSSIGKKYNPTIDEFEYKNPFELQCTLAIIKPDGMKHMDEIIEMFYKNDLSIKKFKVEKLSEEILEEHYSHLLDKPFYPKLRDYMMSEPVAIMVLEGYDAVDRLRELMGPTDSTKANLNTIRGKFGSDITYNAIHGSDSKINADIEINRFFNQKQKRIIK